MIIWLKIIFATIAIFVWFSIVGIAVCNFLKIDVKKYYFPVGLVTIFGLYEIVMYYPIMHHLNRIYSAITIFILIGVSFVYALVNVKKVVKDLISVETLIPFSFAAIGFLILYFFNPMMDIKSDYEFYLSLIRSSNELETLGQYNPYQIGSYQLLGGNHLLYAFYYFVAYLSKIVRLDPYIFAVWVNPLMHVLFAGSVYCLVIEKITKNKTTKLLAIIFAYLSVLCVQGVNLGIYGNVYKTPMFALMYLFLNDYKGSQIKKTITLFVMSAATLSVHQSAVFLLVGVIVAYFIYCSFNKKEELPYIFIWAIPTVLNGLYIYGVYVSKLSILYILFVLVVNIIWKYKKEVIIFFSKIGSISAPILVIIASMLIEFFGKPKINVLGYFDIAFRLNFSSPGWAMETIANYVSIGFAIVYIVYSIKTKNKSLFFYLVLTGMFLYCPLTVDFVSTYMAKGVYDRMGELFLPPIFIIIFLNELNNKKSLKIFICSQIIIFIVWPIAYENVFIDNSYDHLYRTEKDLLKVVRDVDDFAVNNPMQNKNVFSTNLTAHSFTRNLVYEYSLSDFRTVYYYNKSPSNQIKQSIYDLSTKSKLFGDDYDAELIYKSLYTSVCPYFVVGTDQREELYDDLDSKCQRISSTGKYIGYYCEFDYLSK